MSLSFYNTCVGWNRDDVFAPGGLTEMTDNSTDISRQTFLKHVDRTQLKEIESALGYVQHSANGLTMANDACVTYGRGKLHDQTVYFFTQSAINYVFK